MAASFGRTLIDPAPNAEALQAAIEQQWAAASAEMQTWRAEIMAHVDAIMQRALRHESDSAAAVFAVSDAERMLLLLAPIDNDLPTTRSAACKILTSLMHEKMRASELTGKREGISFIGSLLSRVSDYSIDPRDI